MIAKNYIRHPEALRFQREMFSNGYHNSPRIMRLMEVVFSFAASVPQWVKDMKKRAAALVKKWKGDQIAMNFKAPAAPAKKLPGFFYGPHGETWSGRGLMPKWLYALAEQGHPKDLFKYSGRA